MKGIRIMFGIVIAIFVFGFGLLILMLSLQNDKSRFADELIEFTDVMNPEENQVSAEYNGKTYELEGWDVNAIYRVINRGDGSRFKLLFKKEPKNEFIRIQFKGVADSTITKASPDTDVDEVILKYKSIGKNSTKYYSIKNMAMFRNILSILEPPAE